MGMEKRPNVSCKRFSITSVGPLNGLKHSNRDKIMTNATAYSSTVWFGNSQTLEPQGSEGFCEKSQMKFCQLTNLAWLRYNE
ncbi:hypothetical protein GCM10008018_66820 [Paenibacillus marchantiophytorum]|uniref:Uncharacterized protein n=1 Tax=Paenibacillus marchantiophytorum TaxID=1619310 RepID=A0ABQ1FHI3_9BACL|nr:hypothetical protein GCM10008018_66820 [Paenibacillus marchantiophytorum]